MGQCDLSQDYAVDSRFYEYFYLFHSCDSPLFLCAGTRSTTGRYLFLAVLSIIVFYRICRQFTGMLCSPQIAELRILPVDDAIAASIDKGMILFCSYTFSVVMLLALCMELQLGRASFAVLVVVFSTTLIAIIVKGILNSREFVKSRILAASDANRTRNWIVEQFAQFWHVPTLFYFGVVWLILLNDQLSEFNGKMQHSCSVFS